jgi:GntR family transcriptional repressor for pyruvate dehydrogenase complex
VLAQIEEKVLDGSLRPGQKLPSERALVGALGVSRTSVREALRALEAMGIIESRTGSGPDAGSVITAQSTGALTTMRDTGQEYREFNVLDAEFHVGISRSSGNALAADLMTALRGAIESAMTAAFARLPDWQSVAESLVTEHEGILAAIEKGDGDRASELVADHIIRFYQDRVGNS